MISHESPNARALGIFNLLVITASGPTNHMLPEIRPPAHVAQSHAPAHLPAHAHAAVSASSVSGSAKGFSAAVAATVLIEGCPRTENSAGGEYASGLGCSPMNGDLGESGARPQPPCIVACWLLASARSASYSWLAIRPRPTMPARERGEPELAERRWVALAAEKDVSG